MQSHINTLSNLSMLHVSFKKIKNEDKWIKI
jgi:hypothetical protein